MGSLYKYTDAVVATVILDEIYLLADCVVFVFFPKYAHSVHK